MVTVVRADHQTTLTRVAQNVGQIVRVLAGDPHVIGSERVHRKRRALAPEALGQIVQNIRHPLCADLDEAPTDLRELSRHLLFKQRMTRADNSQLELGKSRVRVEEVMFNAINPIVDKALSFCGAVDCAKISGLTESVST